MFVILYDIKIIKSKTDSYKKKTIVAFWIHTIKNNN